MVVLISLVYMSSVERNLSLFSPSRVLVNMMYCSMKYCCSNSYHWSTLWPLEVWVRGLYNSWWFCVHMLSMFIYLSMVAAREIANLGSCHFFYNLFLNSKFLTKFLKEQGTFYLTCVLFLADLQFSVFQECWLNWLQVQVQIHRSISLQVEEKKFHCTWGLKILWMLIVRIPP